MRLIWVRHGETVENAQRKYLGHSDAPLAEEGIAQAERLAGQLYREIQPPLAVYTSDLQRCTATADILARQWGIAPQKVPALRELSFGDWELLTYEQVMQQDPERARSWYDDPFSAKPPNGESLQELGKRVDEWLRSLLEQQAAHGQETCLLVSHGGVIRWFQAAWLQRDPGQYWQVEGLRHGRAMLAVTDGERWRQEAWMIGCEGS